MPVEEYNAWAGYYSLKNDEEQKALNNKRCKVKEDNDQTNEH
jgi:hypothetical protein